jgi:hypothetical protein
MLEADMPRRRSGFWANYLRGGVFSLLARRADRSKVTRMDEAGFATMNGVRYAWSDIASIDRTAYTVFGADAFETVRLRVRQGGLLTLPLSEAKNGSELLAYLLEHAPRAPSDGRLY